MTADYTYDILDRLTNVSFDNGSASVSYTYDNNGNLISRLSGRFTDVNNSVAEEQSINVFGASGQAQNTEGSTAVYYTYDVINRLKNVSSDNGLTASYEYDAKSRRIAKTVNNVTTTHIWDGDYIVREKDNSGAETSRYYHVGNKIVANKSNNVKSYYYSDPHGNIVPIGNNENIYTYDAFGNQTSTPANDANPFRYCGEYFDEETGFIYLRNRYYDSSAGRFITEDPIRDGLNWYAYCANNPVMFVDPSGMTFEELKKVSEKYGAPIALETYNLSEKSRKKAENYAEHNRLTTTFDNEADAYRHFMWNALMTREIGYKVAIDVGNLHEHKSLSDLGWIDYSPRFQLMGSTIIHTKMNQPHLMDLWNNQVGRELANNEVFKHMMPDELFEMAIENNWLITDANNVYEFLGISNYITDSDNWTIDVEWDIKSGNITVTKDNQRVSLKIGV